MLSSGKILGAPLDAITLLHESLWMTVKSKASDLTKIGCTSSSFLEMVFFKGENMASTVFKIKGSSQGRVDASGCF